MLDSILMEAGSSTAELTALDMVGCCAASILMGLVIAVAYMRCSEKYTKNFVITLAILPILVQAVIMLVNGNLGAGVAIVGAFSLVRFRSIAGSSREILAVFFAMTVGLAAGMGYIGYGAIITAVVVILLIVLSKTSFGEKKEVGKQLKVTIPENLNYIGLFDDIFERYLGSCKLERVKTTNLGSMFELTYLISVKDESKEKEFIDEIRTRNGNLTVTCGQISKPAEEL